MSPTDLPDHDTTAAAPADGSLRLLLFNLSSLLGLGALASLWILVYTDWLQAIGGLLTVTGALAWSALLFNMVSEKRKKEIQGAFEQKVLLAPSLWRFHLSFAVGLLILTAGTSTLKIHAFGDATQRALMVYRTGASLENGEPLRKVTLPARGSRRLLFLGYGPFLIKPSGLPVVEVSGGVFVPRVITSPDDFTRSPALLVRPDTGLSNATIGSKNLTLQIERNGETIVGPMLFQGRGIWVGSDRDTEIPDWLRRRWEKEQPVPWVPMVGADKPVTLKQGDQLRIELRTPDTLYIPEKIYTVLPHHGPKDFVQEVVLKF